MSLPDINSIDQLISVINEYFTTPRRPSLKGIEANYVLVNLIEQLSSYTDDQITKLKGDAPEAFDTLVEIANKLADDDDALASILLSIKDKVDKQDGYGLSKNDFTDTYKEQLDNLAENPDPYTYDDSPLQGSHNMVKSGGIWAFVKNTFGNVGSGLIVNGAGVLNLDLISLTLVSPVITVAWTLHNNDGTPYGTPNSISKSLVVDKGVKADIQAKFSYPSPNSNQAAPTGYTSSTFTGVMPNAGLFSDLLSVISIVSKRTDTVVLQKPKSGLVVSGSQVILPTGYDTTSDSITIDFQGRGFYFYSDKSDLSASDIQALYNSGLFQTSKARLFTAVTPGVGKYFYYIYDSALGEYTAVLYNNAEAYFNAFQFRPRLTVVNNAGISAELIVGRSNAVNAFNNSTLAFS